MRALLAGLLVLLLASVAPAQTSGVGSSPVVTLDQDRLFAESGFGKAVNAQADADSRNLAAEFRKIEAALEAEERSLTAQRAILPPEDFRKLADEFDTRVEEVRKAQDGRSRALLRRQEDDRKRFFEAALPVLGKLMEEIGAVAILDRNAIVLSFDRIDITDAAIARLDADLGNGALVPPPEAPPLQTSPPQTSSPDTSPQVPPHDPTP